MLDRAMLLGLVLVYHCIGSQETRVMFDDSRGMKERREKRQGQGWRNENTEITQL